MELRWILILAGVGILAFLYFSGRPKKNRPVPESHAPETMGLDARETQNMQGYEPSAQAPVPPGHPGMQHDHRQPTAGYDADPHAAQMGASDSFGANYDPLMTPQQGAVAPSAGQQAPGQQVNGQAPLQAPLQARLQARLQEHNDLYQQYPAHQGGYDSEQGSVQEPPPLGFDMEPGDMQRPADVAVNPGLAQQPVQQQPIEHGQAAMDQAQYSQGYQQNSAGFASAEQLPPGQRQPDSGAVSPATKPASGLSSLLANLSGGLLGQGKGRGNGMRAGDNDNALYPNQGSESMIITLHVVAPDGQVIHGPRLQALFEQRGYHFGEMNIFHSLNQGSIVFSVAKIIEPGTFDINNPGSFETPGISLILQLPAPVASDVAFDVLVSEATEMANALGCNILDAGHSNLSRQTIQHLRDSVHQFMHRQRLAETVPS